MGPSPMESSVENGIVAVTKRILDPTGSEKDPPMKRRHSLTSSDIDKSDPGMVVAKPEIPLPQNQVTENATIFEGPSGHNGAADMVMDNQSHGDEFKTSSSPKFSSDNLNPFSPLKTNSNTDSSSKVKKVTFKEKKDKPVIGSPRYSSITPSPEAQSALSILPPPKEKVTSVMKLSKDLDKYHISDDLKNTKANITLAQVLEISNQARSELTNNLKKERINTSVVAGLFNVNEKPPETEIVNNPYHSYNSKCVDEHDIAVVKAKLNDAEAFLLVDACSNANLVSRKFLDGKIKEYQVEGYIDSKIQQAMEDDVTRTYELVALQVSLGTLSFPVLFRVADNENPFYDAIIGLKVQHDNRIIVDSVDKVVSFKTSEGTLQPLTPIVDIESFNKQCYFCYVYPKDLTLVAATNVMKPKVKEDFIKSIVDDLDISKSSFCTTEPIDALEFNEILMSFIDVIACSSDDLTPSKLFPHHIELIDGARPVKSKVRKMSQVQLKALKNELTDLLNKGLIVPSHSSWASPIVLVPKKNNKWRLCADYRKVNSVTKKDAYSIPNIREAFESLTGAVFFSALDLFSGYHQIPMLPEDQDITAITTRFGNFNYVVMPFGLTNAPATFQREMNRIFYPLLNTCVQVYLDDIIVYSPSFSQHLKDLESVFKILRENLLKVNIEKCHFCKQEIEVLGHLVSVDGLRPIPSKLKVIESLSRPTSVTELRSFLGLIGYYRDFIDNFSSITAPLNKLLRKNVPFDWSDECDKAFRTSINCLSSAPILCFPRYDIPFIIRSDASYNGIGGALLQLLEDGVEHPIRFVSRSLKKSEFNYPITELEGTAAYYCLSEFNYYILGNPYKTILYTDHLPLVSIINKTDPQTAKHARWINDFSQSQVEVRYQPGKENKIADALSRLTLKEENCQVAVTNIDDSVNTEESDEDSEEEPLSRRKQRKFNENSTNDNNTNEEVTSLMSEELANILDDEENDKYVSEVMKNFLKDRFILMGKQLYFRDKENLRKVVEEPLDKIKIIAKAHQTAHEGVQKTYLRIKENYYWRNMILDIKKYVTTCKICQLRKPQPVPEKFERYGTPVEAPFVRIAVDIVGPLKSSGDNRYIIVAVDYFTRWPEAKAVSTITSEDVTEFLVEVFSRHGTPQLVLMDNGVQFTSDYSKIFLDLYDTYIHFVSIYHPESNGLVENRNREIGKQLRFLVEEYDDWDKYLPIALWALRTSISSSTGFSSFELLYGRKAMLPIELVLMETYSGETGRTTEEVLMERFITHAKWVKKAASKMLGTLKYWEARQKSKLSMKNKDNYKCGDLVKVRNFNRTKLEPYFRGPYQIIDISWNTVKLKDLETGQELSRYVHFKNILPYHE